MAILQLMSPPIFAIGGEGDNWQTQFTANPFGPGDKPVWFQCTTKYVAGRGQSDFGVLEIDFLDGQGQFQRQTFTNRDAPFGSLIDCGFVPRLLAITVAAHTYDAAISGTLTLFHWG